VLVAASSKHGATGEIADVIADELRTRLPDADVVRRDLDDGDTLGEVDAAVLGSAVYMGRWRKPARRFVELNSTRLREVPVWLFSSGPLGDPPVPAGDPDVGALVTISGAVDHRTFAGRLDQANLTRAERLVAHTVGAPSGDFRGWADVRDWATAIARVLSEITATV
jgi:menaquinone-dependent protoporphyrinogen oxidase